MPGRWTRNLWPILAAGILLPIAESRGDDPPETTAAATTASDFDKECRGNLRAVAALRDAMRTLEHSDPGKFALRHHNEIFMIIDRVEGKAEIFAALHPDAQLRSAARVIRNEAVALRSEMWRDPNLYLALARVDPKRLGEVERRARELALENALQCGADHDQAKRDTAQALIEQIKQKEGAIEALRAAGSRTVEVTSTSRLRGLSSEFTAALRPGPNGVLRLSTVASTALAVLQDAEDAALRREMFEASGAGGDENLAAAVAELLAARTTLQALVRRGPASHVDAALLPKRCFARDTEFVRAILTSAESAWRRESAALLATKRALDPGATAIEPWDVRFLLERERERELSLHRDELRPYLEITRVKQVLLDIASELFDLRFVPAKEANWHDSVECYNVVAPEEPKRRIGVMFFDLFAREGKSPAPASYWVQAGVAARPMPHAVVSLGISPSLSGATLLDPIELRSLCRAFGGALHRLLAGRHGWHVLTANCWEDDVAAAVECVFESWADDPTLLARFARHVESKEPVPASIIESSVRARRFGEGLEMVHALQCAAALLDLHSAELQSLPWKERLLTLEKRHAAISKKQGTRAVFDWEEVTRQGAAALELISANAIACDIDSAFRTPEGKRDFANRETARRFRRFLLDPGASCPAAKALEEFLGRPHSPDALARRLGAP